MIRNAYFFRYRILWHVLFWVSVYLFYSVTYGSNITYAVQFKLNFYLLPVRMFFTYIFIYYILPKFLLNRKYLLFSILTVLHAILYGFIVWMLIESYLRCFSCDFKIARIFNDLSSVMRVIILNYPIPAIASAVVIFKRWVRTQQYNIDLQKEKLEAELNFLKTQIHPHFLFNTLNNLYALTLIKSEKAPDIVIKLSELLDYMLYNSNEKEVKLQKEINQLKGYIDLEKIRYGDRLDVKFEITGNAFAKYVAPLILLPFLENSFKHGVNYDINSPFIHIYMDIKEDYLSFNIQNSCRQDEHNVYSLNEGIGLKNVRRRLALLYPNQHHLSISENSDVFEISLVLNWPSKKRVTPALN